MQFRPIVQPRETLWSLEGLLNPFPPGRGGLLSILAIFTLGFVLVYFVAPQAPIRIRYVAVVTVLSLPLLLGLYKDRFAILYTLYTGYVVLLGLYYTMGGDGLPADALYPLKSWLVVLLLLGAMEWLRASVLVVFSGFWILAQALAAAYEFLRGPIWSVLPFPIFSDDHMQLIEARNQVNVRSGGFTFEASILGVMLSFFVIFCLLNVLKSLTERHNNIGSARVYQGVCLLPVGLGFAAILLLQTKSGILVTGVALGLAVLMVIVGPYSPKEKLLSLVSTVGAALILIIGFTILLQTHYGAYVEDEIERLYRSIYHGYSQAAESGIETRKSYMIIGLKGILYHPLGVGYSSGYIYAAPVLDSVNVTREMQFMFESGSYRGYKAEFYNEMMMAGVVFLASITLAFGFIYKMARIIGDRFLHLTAVVMMVALLVSSLIVELWPFWESIALLYAWLKAIERESVPLLTTRRIGAYRPSS